MGFRCVYIYIVVISTGEKVYLSTVCVEFEWDYGTGIMILFERISEARFDAGNDWLKKATPERYTAKKTDP